MQNADGEYVQIGNTEWLKNERNPRFATKLKMTYTFEIKQRLQFLIVDVDDPNDLTNVNEIGKLECTLGQIAGSRGCKMTRDLVGEKPGKYGSITILAEELKGRTTDLLAIKMKGTEILNKDGFMGKSDPFLIFKSVRADGAIQEVSNGKSNVIDNSESPFWEEMRMGMVELCNGDLEGKIIVECWDFDSLSGNDQIGLVETTVGEILAGKELVMKDYKEGRDLKPGKLQLVSGSIVRIPSFLDYLGSGCEITVSFAIDFTMSNKEASEEASLHYTGGEGYNQYQQAMVSVGEILENYDHDKKFAVVGYGGIPPGKEEADHCFALSMNEQDPEVDGVQGLLDVYASAIASVRLYGPTNFAEVLKQSHMMANEQRKQHYHVLVIVTDGDITDMQKTKNAIIEASYQVPLSVVIVGVGDEDFSAMEDLDADGGGLLHDDGRPPFRDIVQFVPFKEALADSGGVAKKLLEEIPGQLLQYMCVNKKPPPKWSTATDPADKYFTLPEGKWA